MEYQAPASAAPMVIDEPWEQLPRTAKFDRMLARRGKIRAERRSYERHVDILVSLLQGLPPGPVLEVASGMGFHLLELGRKGIGPLVAAEIDPALSGLTQAAARAFAVPASAVSGDACAIPLADSSCAAVYSHSFFEHVYDVNKALAEQIRVLKPGGRLLIFDGNLLNPKLVFDLLVMYPFRTKGRHGGLRWIFGKRRVYRNLYGYLPLGRDEDIKTPRWWRRRLEREPDLVVHRCTTGGVIEERGPALLRRFIGSCVVVAEKRGRAQ